MEQKNDELVLIAKLVDRVTRQEKLIGVMAQAIEDQSILLEKQLTVCQAEACCCAATKLHSVLDIRMCDDCMTATVKRALDNLTTDEEDALNTIRASTARLELWVDLPDAAAIRRITRYNKIAAKVRDDKGEIDVN